MTITSSARIDRILYQYQDAVLKYGDDFDLVVAAIEAALPDVDIDEIVLALRNLAVSFENWAKARRKAERGVTNSSAIKENEAGQISPWTEAFYDRDYGRDQTRRMAIYDRVVDFLQSIGCRVSWTAGHDGAILITTTVSSSPASPIRAKNSNIIPATKFATNFQPNSLKSSTPSLAPCRVLNNNDRCAAYPNRQWSGLALLGDCSVVGMLMATG